MNKAIQLVFRLMPSSMCVFAYGYSFSEREGLGGIHRFKDEASTFSILYYCQKSPKSRSLFFPRLALML